MVLDEAVAEVEPESSLVARPILHFAHLLHEDRPSRLEITLAIELSSSISRYGTARGGKARQGVGVT